MGAQDADQDSFTPTYQATAAADVVVSANPAFLHSIIIGEYVSGATLEVSNHASDGDGNVVIYLYDAAVGTFLVDAAFSVGICADLTTQTHVTFIWR